MEEFQKINLLEVTGIIEDKEKLKLVNETLGSVGYTQKAEMGNLLIITEFSAKNSFNATVKNIIKMVRIMALCAVVLTLVRAIFITVF